MCSTLKKNPQSLTSVRSGMPMDFENIVGKCLEKDSQNSAAKGWV